MQKDKNRQHQRLYLNPVLLGLYAFAVLVVAQIFPLALQGSVSANVLGCPSGTNYSELYKKCLGPATNGQCPAGTQKDNSVPPPNNCTGGTTTPPGNAGSGGSFNGDGGVPTGAGRYTCGSGQNAVKVTINFGCRGKGSGLADLTFAIIRFLSAGVGLVVVGSIVVAGIQYTTSRGDPNTTAQAIKRIRNSVYALLIYLFTAAILNFILPEGFLK